MVCPKAVAAIREKKRRRCFASFNVLDLGLPKSEANFTEGFELGM
jgi:hypothetical protein